MTNAASTPYAIALLRVSLGVMTLAHGLLEVLVFTIPGTVGFFESLGFPGALAYPVIAAEIGGGAFALQSVLAPRRTPAAA